MLSKKSLSLASHIAATSNRSITIPRFGLFAEPIRLSAPPLKRESAPSLESAVADIGTTSEVMVQDTNRHEVEINNSMRVIGERMKDSFNFVRKTIIPFIDDVTNAIIDRVEENRPKSFTIIQLNMPEIATSEVFLDIISKYQNNQEFESVRTLQGFEDISSLINKLKTNVPEIDDALAASIARLGDSAVYDIYQRLFCNTNPPNINTSTQKIIAGMMIKQHGNWIFHYKDASAIDVAIVVFFMTEAFYDNPLEGTGLSLAEYQLRVGSMRNAAGYALNNLIQRHLNLIRNNILILHYPISTGIHYKEEQGEIVVIGEVYRKGLKEGVTPEAVIGAAINPSKKLQSLDSIQQVAGELVKVHDRVVREAMTHAANNRARYVRNSIVATIQTKVNSLPENTWPADFDKTAAVAQCGDASTIDYFFAKEYNEEQGNLNDLVEKLVCKYLFTFIDGKIIIDLIMDELNNSEEAIDIKDASYFAFLRYYAKWAVATFDIETIN